MFVEWKQFKYFFSPQKTKKKKKICWQNYLIFLVTVVSPCMHFLKWEEKKKQLWTVLKIKNLLLKNLFCNFMVCVLFIQCTMAVFSNGRFAWYAVLSSRASAAALCGTLNITLEWEMGTLEKVGWKKGNQKSSKCDWGGSTEGIWLHVLGKNSTCHCIPSGCLTSLSYHVL